MKYVTRDLLTKLVREQVSKALRELNTDYLEGPSTPADERENTIEEEIRRLSDEGLFSNIAKIKTADGTKTAYVITNHLTGGKHYIEFDENEEISEDSAKAIASNFDLRDANIRENPTPEQIEEIIDVMGSYVLRDEDDEEV